MAAANAIVYNINTGILFQKTNAKMKCGAAADVQIPLDSLAANDITSGAAPLCTTIQISDPNNRRFIDGASFPANPYNNLTNVGDCVNTTYVGYCYNETNGIITASSATSHTNTCTNCNQACTINGGGSCDDTCSGSGCIQTGSVSGGGGVTMSCPGGYCQQSCSVTGGGSCDLTCAGGNCTQITSVGGGGGVSATCTGGGCSCTGPGC